MVPTNRFLTLLLPALLPAALASVHPLFLPAALGYAGILSIALLLDAASLPRREQLAVRRDVPPTLSLAEPARVALRVRSLRPGTIVVEWRDAPPLPFRDGAVPVPIAIPDGAEASWGYAVTPLERGEHAFGPLHLRVRSPLGLAARRYVYPLSSAVRVLPDLRPLAGGPGLLSRRGARATGLRNLRQRGEGREFESLKEYAAEDEFRTIDWKATARTGRLISRQYQAERDQIVLLLLDAGRNLSPRAGDLTRFDHAVNAALRLAAVAVEAGDQVGLLAFSSEVRAFLAPRKGRRQLRKIAEALGPLMPDETEADYASAFGFVRARLRRRALLVLFTELMEPESSRVLLRNFLALLPRHLPFCLTLADPELVSLTDLVPRGAADAYLLTMAREFEEDRRRTRAILRNQGALVAEVPAEGLAGAAVRRYLDIKERGLL